MGRLPVIAFAHGWAVSAMLLGLTAWSLNGAARLAVDVSSDSLVARGSAERAAHEASRHSFGSDEAAAIYAEHPDLADPQRVAALRQISRALENLPFVERVESLFTLPDVRDEEGRLHVSPSWNGADDSPQALRAALDRARDNPLLRGQVVSEDGQATVLTLFLSPAAGVDNQQRTQQIEALLAPHRGRFTHLEQVGGPATRDWLTRQMSHDQRWIVPLAVGVLLLLLTLTLGSAVAAMLPVLNAAMAVAWAYAGMALLGVPMNLLSYVLPVLVLVVGAAGDVHLIHEFRVALRRGLEPRQAMAAASRRVTGALVLTSLTTVLGFAATALSDLPILQDFGAAAALAMVGRFTISLLFLPACLRLTLPLIRPRNAVRTISPWGPEALTRWLIPALHARQRVVLAAILILTATALLFASRIRVANDLLAFVRPDAPVVLSADRLTQRLSGLKFIHLTLHAQPDAFAEPRALHQLDAVAQWARVQPGVDSAIAVSDLLKRLRGQLHGAGSSYESLPDSAAAVRQLLLFCSWAQYRPYLTADFAHANIVIRSDLQDTAALNRLLTELRRELDSGRFGPVRYTLTGQAALVAQGVDSVTRAQAFSLGGTTLTLFLVVGAIFLSWRAALLVLAANLIPITLVLGIMGAAGISLNVGTCMVAAISLGIVVDDTLHLLVQFNREARARKDERLGVEAALRDELPPIFISTVALAGGFAALGLSSFEPVRQFGLLSAAAMVLAFVCEVIVTPLFLTRTRIVTLWDVLGLPLRGALLRQSPFFEGLSRWQAKKIILACDVQAHAAGSTVLRAGEMGDRMFVVVQGDLEVHREHEGQRTTLAKLTTGDLLGEMAFFSHQPRSADVTALSDAQLLALDFQSMERLRRFSPYLASRLLMNIARVLSLRLARATASK